MNTILRNNDNFPISSVDSDSPSVSSCDTDNDSDCDSPCDSLCDSPCARNHKRIFYPLHRPTPEYDERNDYGKIKRKYRSKKLNLNLLIDDPLFERHLLRIIFDFLTTDKKIPFQPFLSVYTGLCDDGSTALHNECKGGSLRNIVWLLSRKNVDPNSNAGICLYNACLQRRVRTANILLDYGANPCMKNFRSVKEVCIWQNISLFRRMKKIMEVEEKNEEKLLRCYNECLDEIVPKYDLTYYSKPEKESKEMHSRVSMVVELLKSGATPPQKLLNWCIEKGIACVYDKIRHHFKDDFKVHRCGVNCKKICKEQDQLNAFTDAICSALQNVNNIDLVIRVFRDFPELKKLKTSNMKTIVELAFQHRNIALVQMLFPVISTDKQMMTQVLCELSNREETCNTTYAKELAREREKTTMHLIDLVSKTMKYTDPIVYAACCNMNEHMIRIAMQQGVIFTIHTFRMMENGSLKKWQRFRPVIIEILQYIQRKVLHSRLSDKKNCGYTPREQRDLLRHIQDRGYGQVSKSDKWETIVWNVERVEKEKRKE